MIAPPAFSLIKREGVNTTRVINTRSRGSAAAHWIVYTIFEEVKWLLPSKPLEPLPKTPSFARTPENHPTGCTCLQSHGVRKNGPRAQPTRFQKAAFSRFGTALMAISSAYLARNLLLAMTPGMLVVSVASAIAFCENSSGSFVSELDRIRGMQSTYSNIRKAF